MGIRDWFRKLGAQQDAEEIERAERLERESREERVFAEESHEGRAFDQSIWKGSGPESR